MKKKNLSVDYSNILFNLSVVIYDYFLKGIGGRSKILIENEFIMRTEKYGFIIQVK